MDLVNQEKLEKFWRKNPDTQLHLETWCKEVENACWTTPHELKKTYSKAGLSWRWKNGIQHHAQSVSTGSQVCLCRKSSLGALDRTPRQV